MSFSLDSNDLDPSVE
jgi:hypothetical protein